MPDLFDAQAKPTEIKRGAVISECGTYRYGLTRSWGDERPACFIMLNPSTADATQDDPTIRRCIRFAKSWGRGGIIVVNLFAFRSTWPRDLLKATDPVGPDNDNFIRDAVIACDPVVAAWGNHGTIRGRDRSVCELIRLSGLPWPMCFAITKEGQPKHPLYVKADAKLIKYPGRP